MRNLHWLFLHVRFSTRNITLYDLLGTLAVNERYLTATTRYLYDRELRRNQAGTPGYEEYAASWTKTDGSGTCPRQRNGYDCGLFVILSMAMMAQGVPLSARTYTQDMVNRRRLRRRLVHMIWADCRTAGAPRGLEAWARGPQRPAAAPRTKRPTPQQGEGWAPCMRVPKARSESAYRRKRHRAAMDSSSLALGGWRVKRRVGSTGGTAHAASRQRIAGRKRLAESIAIDASDAIRLSRERRTPSDRETRRRRHTP